MGFVPGHQSAHAGGLHPREQLADNALHPGVALGPDARMPEAENCEHLRAPTPEATQFLDFPQQLCRRQSAPALARITMLGDESPPPRNCPPFGP